MEGEDSDIIEIQFQVKSDLSKVILHESALYISYKMENYLIRKFNEAHLCHRVMTTVEYFTNFSLIKISADLSPLGKENIALVLALVQKSITFLKDTLREEQYAKAKFELEAIFETAHYRTDDKFTELLAEKVSRFGLKHSIRGTRTLNSYNKRQILSILN